MKTLGKRIAALMLTLLLALTAYALAEGETKYELTGADVLFYIGERTDSVTEAAAGDSIHIEIDPEGAGPGEGKYFTEQFTSEDVNIDGNTFLMPARAVHVDATVADQTDYPVDLSGAQPVILPEYLSGMLSAADGAIDKDGIWEYDLNGDGQSDVCLFYRDNAVQRMDGVDLLGSETGRVDLHNYEYLCPYKSVVFRFVSGGEHTQHTYGMPEWRWAEDFSTAKAIFNCTGCDDSRNIDATVSSAAVPATCTGNAATIHTATVKFNGAPFTDSQRVETPDTATGHDYTADWHWTEDLGSATATITCKRGDVDPRTVDATVEALTEPDCVSEGRTVYTATATLDGKPFTDQKIVSIPAAGHNYSATWTWEDDYSAAKLTLACSRCGFSLSGVKTDVAAQISPATCGADGKAVYTATAAYEGAAYTDVKEVVLPATGHRYGKPVWTWTEDHSAATATFTCPSCNDVQRVTATVTAESLATGGTRYIASAAFLGVTYFDNAFEGAVTTHTLTISYVDGSGAPVAEPYVAQLAEGAAFAVASPTLTRLRADRAAVEGAMGTTDIVETVTYWDDTVAITFFTNSGASKKVAVQTAWRGEQTTLQPNPFKLKGYRFMAWNTQTDGKGAIYADGAQITPTEDMSLYAQWSALIKIEFSGNGSGGGKMDSLSAVVGETVKLPKNQFTPRSDYEFTGWNTEKNGKGKAYADGAEITIPEDQTKTIKLYAQWKGKKTTIKFDSNGGSGKGKSMPTIKTSVDARIKLPKCAFTHGENAFDCWTINKSGVGKAYGDGETITVSQSGTVTLYAQWKGLRATVSFGKYADAITVTTPARITLPENNRERTGYALTAWKLDSNNVFAPGDRITVRNDLKLTAGWTKQCKISFNANKGSGRMSDQYGLPGENVRLNRNAFTRGGYTFTGWNTQKDGTGQAYKDRATIRINDTHSLTLYAQWKQEMQVALQKLKSIRKGDEVTLKATVTRDGEPVKNVQVRFEFNGSSARKKTNGEGVATWEVPRNKLKKLDVGDTVEYSVTVGDVAVRKTVKVIK